MTRATRLAGADETWAEGPADVLLGVDIVELVSSSMYVEPLTTYREYVQNAADAIDDARDAGLLAKGEHGHIDVTIDAVARNVSIRDNGTGISSAVFVTRLTAFGASEKRAKQRRGLRGVGRLAGLGYCQELIFRTRAAGEAEIRELKWDCRELRAVLRSPDFAGTVREAVRRATFHRSRQAPDYPVRFFEVELRGVVRHGNDELLNESLVRSYLGQVAPVPFSRSFRHREDIHSHLADVLPATDLHIFVNGVGPVQRPFADTIPMRDGIASNATEFVALTIPGLEGGVAAKGWVLHHDYLGAVPRTLGVRGLRLRSGNMQVGDDATLDVVFAEPRFNAWSIGEFHILDRRIVPNGRRDQYEQSVHFANVLNYLAPIARAIVGRCRGKSQYRQALRKVELFEERISNGLAVLRQGAISADARRTLLVDLDRTLHRMQQVGRAQYLSAADKKAIVARHRVLRGRVDRAANQSIRSSRLLRLSDQKRRVYEEVFSFIYDCASDVRVARELVDRVLKRLRP